MLSLGTDLGLGQPMEHVLRQSLIALRLAEQLQMDDSERRVVYYTSLVSWVGCHVDAYEQAKWFGDDIVLKGDSRRVDLPGRRFVLGHLGTGQSVLDRARTLAAFARDRGRPARDMIAHHWLATEALAARLGMTEDVRACLEQTFERWDGKGAPAGREGSEILVTASLVNLADVAEVYHHSGGVEAAVAVARDRRGTQFDPDVVDVFCEGAPGLLADLDATEIWDTVIAAEPPPTRWLTDAQLDDALEAIADFTDLKSPWTIGHSRTVAEVAFAASQAFGLPEEDAVTLRRAALVHDLGRLGVSNAIWDKPGGLSPAELERVRLHPYLSERMLARSPALAALGAIAVQHHERLDGSGYPRGLRGAAMTPAGRLLAAADVYCAMCEPRPHRSARDADEAALGLRAEAAAGRLDREAVEAVLQATGHAVRRRREWPAGLTAREVEVLRLVARGMTNRQIAEELVITPKTAGNHVQRIYEKTGVSNRTRASLFAVEHALMPEATGTGAARTPGR